MKKIIILIFLFISVLGFTQTYEIETSQGVRTITVPEGYTLEQTLIEIAGLYFEERYDLEELLQDHSELITEVEQYQEMVDIYREEIHELMEKYSELTELYEKKQRMANFLFLPTAGIDYSNDSGVQGKFGIGLLLFQRAWIQLEIGVPYSIGFTFGYKTF